MAQFNFSLWQYHPAEVDYALIPPMYVAGQGAQYRYLANSNRIILGVLVQQTRWAATSCGSDRFLAIDDVCQSTDWRAPRPPPAAPRRRCPPRLSTPLA